jgi:acyl-CoA reductase-like NAD-dependent aldehyde dehydrogenase
VTSVVARGTVEAADAVAAAARYAAAPLPAVDRCAALRRLGELLRTRPNPLAELLVEEVRKPIALARAEVIKSAEVAERAAAEWETMGGEVVATDTVPGAAGRVVLVTRHPVGVVCAITPFNFPVGLATHKVLPALVAGNACVVKPSERAPRTAQALRELILEAGFPPDAVPLVLGGPEVVDALLAQPEIGLYSFTGSVGVGEKIKAASGLRPVVLELGSNAAAIVAPDADLDRAAASLARGAYGFAGQACFSVQRIIVHRDVADELTSRLLDAIDALPVGDPHDEAVVVGPLIDEVAAVRVESLVTDAAAAGARVLRPPRRRGALVEPALLAEVPHDADLWRNEAFGPVAVLVTYGPLDEAIAMANDSRYGLQTAIFTADMGTALRAAAELRTGGVVLNEASWRCTPMPFGGVGDSGFGREGPRYAIEASTIERAVVLSA